MWLFGYINHPNSASLPSAQADHAYADARSRGRAVGRIGYDARSPALGGMMRNDDATVLAIRVV